jgi:hypothetical protein
MIDRSARTYGRTGAATAVDMRSLRRDIVVGTPARLLRLMREGSLQVGGVELMVFDECDRLLHVGFTNDLRKLARPLPDQFRSLFLSVQPRGALHERLAALVYGPADVLPKVSRDGSALLWRVVQVLTQDAAEVVRNVFEADAKTWPGEAH